MSTALRRHIESIVPLNDEEFTYILSHFTEKHFRKHQFIEQEGNYVKYDYFLIEGLTKTFFTNEQGKEHILEFAMDNYWVTDIQALQNETQSTLNISCLSNCHVLSISKQKIEKLCAEVDKMQFYFRKKAMNENALLQKRILCLIKNNAAARYHDLASNHPELIQKVPKTLIASYVGVSRETLSRMLMKHV
ncbi:MAG: Crp/Fnr family transcriptional regulator [Chitinophagaceae bacterium]|nr:Crp/Fnr family transcriptional regulator [Chitinophagaceae bacterium]